GILGFRAGRHLIFYRIENKQQIQVARILHEQMDLRNRIAE
ncbi:MAG: type II toxin-antitoxin system RelE/ParE family toxin, partial [Chitinophagaceae bacterium]|nr:type II toxin-antitoxin system RelE/ParE family toxin [Chitinophagaceae bacterium]